MKARWQHGPPQVAFVSGGGSGIGRRLAAELLAAGADVAVFDLSVSEAALAELQGHARGPQQRLRAYTVDITDPAAVDAAMDRAVGELGAPDFALNSAGILRTAVFTEMDYATFEQVVRVNLLGSRNFAAAVLRHLPAGGHLVLIASLAAICGTYTQAAYAASKFGVLGLAEVLRTELRPRGIDVSVVCPGEIRTPLLDHERAHGSPVTELLNQTAGVLDLEPAVASILAGLRRRQYMITPGLRARVVRELARRAPGLFHRLIDRKLARALGSDKTLPA